MEESGKHNFVGGIIFALNVFIAIMIITSSGALVKTDFGKTAMIFGFVMLAVSVILKLIQRW